MSRAAVVERRRIGLLRQRADPRRYSSDWREALKEDTDRRIAEEQKRIEAEAARQEEAKRAYERSLPR